MVIKVGVLASRLNYYSYNRNIGIVPDVQYIKVWDTFSVAQYIMRKARRVTGRNLFSTFNWNNQFYDANLNNVDVFHFLNAISFGKTPWITTFETLVPRYNYILWHHKNVKHLREIQGKGFWIKRSFEAMAGDSCQHIIALSEAATKFQYALLRKYPEFYEPIKKKMMVLHPPQHTDLKNFSDKKIEIDGEIKFMLVGAAFFRKGGQEILDVFIHMRERYKYPIKLLIVSSLSTNDYVAPRSETDVIKAKQLISQYEDWIEYYPSLPNDQVLQLMKQVHIGLLPTYADSYGYSVLEFQAMGCPVITTNVRALPEINNNDIGWVIDVPKDDLGEGLYSTEDEREVMSVHIKRGLESAIHQIFSERDGIPRKSNKVIQRIKLEHSPLQHAEILKRLYEESMGWYGR